MRGLAVGNFGLKISVIDERCELDADQFSNTAVDVFRGYRRGLGMQLALRVMSPDIIAVDEIGVGEEGSEMLESLLSGVKFIATAHASEYEELKRRPSLKGFFELGVFDTFVRIVKKDEGFACEIIREEERV